MRFRLELDIDLPRERVVELFLDPDNLTKWQPDLIRVEGLDGEIVREVGAKTVQIHRMGGREVETLETIQVHDHPERFSATYEANKVWNLIENRFVETGESTTHWVLDSEVRFSGLLRLMGWFMPGAVRGQAETFMKRFKEFVEGESLP